MSSLLMFHDRTRELATLESRWSSGRAELLVLYGRRRVGKTELLLQFLNDKPHLYLLGDLRSEHHQLAEVGQRLHALTGDPLLRAQSPESWTTALEYLARLATSQRLAVVLDELQYFAESTPALLSLIQKTWDEQARHSSIMLILCGSYVSFMESEILAYASPLYGRRTAQLHLQPLDYYDTLSFFPGYAPADAIAMYGIVGGMPGYLGFIDPNRTVAQNIADQLLDQSAVLASEARFLLMEELREPRNYFSVLRAIAYGKTRLGEIGQEAGLPSNSTGKYLDVLQGLRLVERIVPVTERNPDRSRQGIYRIVDNYLTFWFRFILPNQSYLEEGRAAFVLEQRILPSLSSYLGPRFEEVCRQFLRRRQGTDQVPILCDRFGGWWSGGEEIDVLGVRDNVVVLAAECKWTNEWVKIGELNELRRKAALAGAGPETRYALFSRSGFDPNLRAVAQAEGVLLYEIEDLVSREKS